MKFKKLLALVSILAVMFSFTGCDEKFDKPFAYDDNEIAVDAMTSFIEYESISDEYIDYYMSSGSEFEQSAVKGIVQARETDKVGEFEDFSTTATFLSSNTISLKDAGVEIINNKDYVTVVIINNAQNRDVEISVKYVENPNYYIDYNKALKEQGLESFDVFASGIQYAASMNGLTMEQIFVYNNVTSMEELYQVGLQQVEAQLNAQGIRPYVKEEMVVAAIYSNKELVGQAGMNTLIGMGTVFIVLIFISFVISLFKYLPALFAKKPKVETEKKDNTTKKASAKTSNVDKKDDDSELLAVITAAAKASANEDAQLMAVITAAIHEYEAQSGNGAISKDRLVVRSIKKVRK